MNLLMNELYRRVLSFFFSLIGELLIAKDALSRKDIPKRWKRLKETLLSDQIQPTGYDGQKDRLLKLAKESTEEVFFAQTSGTRSLPKVVPYKKSKLKKSQFIFLRSMILLTHAFKGKKTFFVLSSLAEDTSLTAGLIKQDSPKRIELLQAPYRYLTTKEGERLRYEIGADAARTALLIISAPRFLYATNPSTLTHFLDLIKHDWEPLQSNLLKLLNREDLLRPLIKLQDGDGLARLKNISHLSSAPDVATILPRLKAVITWDGGYVSPFTKKLMNQLPGHVKHVPMYSMSTETIETLPHLINDKLHFLPTMTDTYPEFLANGKIFSPFELMKGETYTLIITNKDGFLRYDTQDEFIVHDFIDGLPDLRFKRRRNITASMTGEKISEEQCYLLFEELRRNFPITDYFLTLYGSAKDEQFRYHLGLIGQKNSLDLNAITLKAEELLGNLNEEYRSKVHSGRLLPMTGIQFTLPEFAKLMGQETRWESQFKVMPLYERPLE